MMLENVPGERPAEPCSNIFTEFLSSAWRSGLQRPIESLEQLAGAKVVPITVNDPVEGYMKVANVAGSAVGELVRFALEARLLGGLIGKRIERIGTASAETWPGRFTLAGQKAATFGLIGAADDGLLTPLKEGQSSWHRAGNAGVGLGTFATFGATKTLGNLNTQGFSYGFMLRPLADYWAGDITGSIKAHLEHIINGQSPDLNSRPTGWAMGNTGLEYSRRLANALRGLRV